MPMHESHSHSHASSRSVRTSPLARYLALALLAVLAASVALGLILLWPDGAKVAQLADRAQATAGVTGYERGEIMGIGDDCAAALGGGSGGRSPEDGGAGSASPQRVQQACKLLQVRVQSGPDTGRLVELPLRGGLAVAGLQVGDAVQLIAYPGLEQGASGAAADDGSGADAPTQDYRVTTSYGVSGVFRDIPLLVLALLFVAVVVAVGRLRGLLALAALGVSAGVLLLFVLPGLVAGGPGLLIGVVGSSAIMFVILYLVHGPNMRTTAALVGTLFGILIMAGISFVAVHTTRLSGVGDEASGMLSVMVSEIDFRGLLSCAILIAGLGVLNDVTITQASSVWELRAIAPAMPRREIYRRAMRIGRDHLASTVYTVFFAYVGAAMSVLILLFLYNRPMLSLLTSEDIAIEVVRTLCGSIGLVLAIPITTWVATLFVPPTAGEGDPAHRDRDREGDEPDARLRASSLAGRSLFEPGEF